MDEEGKKAVLEDEWRVSMMPRMEFVVSNTTIEAIGDTWNESDLSAQYQRGHQILFSLDLSPEVQEGLVELFAELSEEERLRFYYSLALVEEAEGNSLELATGSLWVIEMMSRDEYDIFRFPGGDPDLATIAKISLLSSAETQGKRDLIEEAFGESMDRIFSFFAKKDLNEKAISLLKSQFLHRIFDSYYDNATPEIKEMLFDDPWLLRSYFLIFHHKHEELLNSIYLPANNKEVLQELLDRSIFINIWTEEERYYFDIERFDYFAHQILKIHQKYPQENADITQVLLDNIKKSNRPFTAYYQLSSTNISLIKKANLIRELPRKTSAERDYVRYQIRETRREIDKARSDIAKIIDKVLNALNKCQEEDIPIEQFLKVDPSIEETIDMLPPTIREDLNMILGIFTDKSLSLYQENKKLSKEELLAKFINNDLQGQFDCSVEILATYFLIYDTRDFEKINTSPICSGFFQPSSTLGDSIVVKNSTILSHETIHSIFNKAKGDIDFYNFHDDLLGFSEEDKNLLSRAKKERIRVRIGDLLIHRFKDVIDYYLKNEVLAYAFEERGARSSSHAINMLTRVGGESDPYDHSYHLREAIINNFQKNSENRKEAKSVINDLMAGYIIVTKNLIEIAYNNNDDDHMLFQLMITPYEEWHIYDDRFKREDLLFYSPLNNISGQSYD
jgi:hypothetical protein